jgi:hypothetical protein
MKIEDNLIKLGISEGIIEFVHSRSKNSEFPIISAEYSINNKYTRNFIESMQGSILVRIVLDTTKSKSPRNNILEYTINVAKIRQKRINLLFSENN